MKCPNCNKPLSTPIQVEFDKLPGPKLPRKDFGVCECTEEELKALD